MTLVRNQEASSVEPCQAYLAGMYSTVLYHWHSVLAIIGGQASPGVGPDVPL